MTTPRSDQMIYGYEQCDNCKWRHIYFHQPVGMETMYLRRTGFGLECVQCNKLSGRTMALAVPVEYSVLFADEDQYESTETAALDEAVVAEQSSVHASMTLVQHLRATVRWISPWTQDGKDNLASYSVMMGIVTIVSMIFGGQEALYAVADLCGLMIGVYLALRLVITLAFVLPLMFASHRTVALIELKSQWRELSEPRLFDRSRDRRARKKWSMSYMVNHGMTRSDARRRIRMYPVRNR